MSNLCTRRFLFPLQEKTNMQTFLHIITIALPLWGLGDFLHAQSLKDLFLKMPQEVCPALSEYNRLEIVDNQQNGKPMQTRNLFSTFSVMEALTDTYARLKLTPYSEKEMKLLPLNNGDHIIMVVSTVHADSLTDSSICFYDTLWTPLPATDYIHEPLSEHFRSIKVSAYTDELTVITSTPIALRTDGSDKPAETAVPVKEIHQWNRENNHFSVQQP